MTDFEANIHPIHESESPPLVPEVGSAPELDASANAELQIHSQTNGNNNDRETGLDSEGPGSQVPEMPSSHANYNVDASNLTTAGLIKVCRHYTDVAKENPDLANRQAEAAVRVTKQQAEMRQNGMDEATIKRQQWAAMRERNKAKAAESSAPEEKTSQATRPEQARQPVTEERIAATVGHAVNMDEVAATGKMEAKPAEIIAPTVQKPGPALLKMDGIVAQQRIAQKTQAVHFDFERARVPTETSLEHHAAVTAVSSEAVTALISKHVSYHDEQLQREVVAATPDVGFEPLANSDAAIRTENLALVQELFDEDEASELPLLESSGGIASLEVDEALLLPADTLDREFDEMIEGIDILAVPLTVNAEVRTLTKTPEQPTWDNVLEIEPLDLYESFTEALQNIVLMMELQVEASEEAPEDNDVQAIERQPELRDVPIISTVVERLVELPAEEKEPVALTLQGIVLSTQIIEALEAEEAELEIVEVVMIQLEEQITTLLEQLGIEYKPEEVEPAKIDLEHDGTHEAKSSLVQFISAVSDPKSKLQCIIGTLAISYAQITGKRQLMPSQLTTN